MFFFMCNCSCNGQYQPEILSGQYDHVAYEKSKFDFKFKFLCQKLYLPTVEPWLGN